jgi:hypothetical protein
MDKQTLKEQVLIELLLNKYKDEEVNASLVRKIMEEFNAINKELKPPSQQVELEKLARNAY